MGLIKERGIPGFPVSYLFFRFPQLKFGLFKFSDVPPGSNDLPGAVRFDRDRLFIIDPLILSGFIAYPVLPQFVASLDRLVSQAFAHFFLIFGMYVVPLKSTIVVKIAGGMSQNGFHIFADIGEFRQVIGRDQGIDDRGDVRQDTLQVISTGLDLPFFLDPSGDIAGSGIDQLAGGNGAPFDEPIGTVF